MNHDSWEVPELQATEYAPRGSERCIVTAAWDEGERSLRQYRQMLPSTAEHDFIVVNRGEYLPGLGAEVHAELGINSILQVETPGQSPAYRAGLAWAMRRGYEGVVIIDSNGKDDPAPIPHYMELLADGVDLVQGSRFMRGGKHENTPLSRVFAIRVVVAGLLWLGTGTWYSDQNNGFKGFSREFLLDPRVQPFRARFGGHSLLPYLNYAAARHDFRIVQVPTTRRYPDDGTVPSKLVSKRQLFGHFMDYVRATTGRLDP